MRSGVAVLVALVAACSALPEMMFGRHEKGFMRKIDEDTGPSTRTDHQGDGYITQTLDHFNATDGRTWKQRYFFNFEHGASETNVNFLSIEGEETASNYWITKKRLFPSYAQQFGANLYALEHRFYGESRPFDTISTANLQYLTSQQALADAAEFIRQINANNSSPLPPQWVVFGGSYAGSLALWFREKYPDLAVGGVGTSGPVLAQVDFYGYMATVEAGIKKYDKTLAPTSKKCADEIDAAMKLIGEYMQTEAGRDRIGTDFNLTMPFATFPAITENILSQFYQSIVSPFMGAAQYGGVGNPTITEVCEEMIKDGEPIYKLAALVTSNGTNPVDVSYQETVDAYKVEKWGEDEETGANSDGRAWIWQTCNEFGYYQSTDMGHNIFGSYISSSQFINFCMDVYGVDTMTLKANIEATNKYYGERDYYTGTNVVISYGTTDPWGFLAKHDSQHESVVVSKIEGGVHCQDFYLQSTIQIYNKDVELTQALVRKNIDKWLSAYEDVPNNVVIADNMGKRPSVYDLFHASPLPVNNNALPKSIAASFELADESQFSRRRSVFGSRSLGFLGDEQIDAASDKAAPLMITQPWDHFDNTNPNVFQQKYFANEKYGSMGGPNFVMFGGEGPANDGWISDESYAWISYAKAVSANVFLLEHRYYGESKLGTNDLQFMTSAQMIHDMASFIKFMKKDQNLTGPWITFGGSAYPSAMSAWAREWFPDLIAGAVASSAPVVAKNDFYEYLMIVEKVLRSVNNACADRVQQGFTKMRDLSQNAAGRKILTNKFFITPSWSNGNKILPEDFQEFYLQVFTPFQDVVQYNNNKIVRGGNWTVEKLCKIMQDTTTYPEAIDAVRAVQVWADFGYHNMETPSSYVNDVAYQKDLLKYIDGKNTGGKNYTDRELGLVLWNWQSCNEFGYFQTTDYGSGIFGNPLPLNFYVNMCEDLFGVGMERIEQGVARTIYQYGGRYRYKGTNVVFTNGNQDPWHVLGVLEQGSLDKSVVTILIDGTAHCADMYPPADTDSQQLKNARVQILDNIKIWLGNAAPSTAPPSTVAATATPPQATTQAGTSTFSFLAALSAFILAAIF